MKFKLISKKIYLKLFFTVAVISLLSLLSTYFLFRYLKVSEFKKRMHQDIRANNYILNKFFQQNLKDVKIVDFKYDKNLSKFMDEFSNFYHSDVILTDSENNCIMKSFKNEIPQKYKQVIKERDLKGNDNFPNIIREISIKPGHKIYLNIFFDEKIYIRSNHFLVAGLLVIAGIVILLLLYISIKITEPLKLLQQSALKISRGDLTARINISRNDEFGTLINIFNEMALKIEQQVTQTKELTANISHELRSPLARIRISKEIISDLIEQDSDKKNHFEQYLNNIDAEIVSMDKLIGDILNYYKIESELNFEKKEQNLIEVLNLVISKVIYNFKTKNIDFKMKFDNEKLFYPINKSMNMVFSNIINNAAKYTNKDGKIIISANKQDNLITFSFFNTCDNALAIDTEKIFQSFYRCNTSSEDTKGTGMGLAIAKKIVENHNGKITANILDNGINFIVSFKIK